MPVLVEKEPWEVGESNLPRVASPFSKFQEPPANEDIKLHIGKIVELERDLLRKAVLELRKELENLSEELCAKEEELIVWDEAMRDTATANGNKLMLARQALPDARSLSNRSGGASPRRSSRTVPSLSALCEAAEEEEQEQEEEEEEEDKEKQEQQQEEVKERESQGDSRMVSPESKETAAVRSVAELLRLVDGELADALRQWQELGCAAEDLRGMPQSQRRVCTVHRIDALLAAIGHPPPDAGSRFAGGRSLEGTPSTAGTPASRTPSAGLAPSPLATVAGERFQG